MDDDETWRALQDAAARLNALTTDTLQVRAARRSFLGVTTEGLEVTDLWTDVWEPVRRIDRFGGSWDQFNSVDQAEEHIRHFLSERPDLV